ncbi:unnamed protein product [Mytilus edulis]|uniref:Cadherin domain-containing protein n=1 Tax=Mytilus edulis TaxID=6550 RepID=A0A8S3TXQ1_MYTED|nr:unnamed protein product [Mytilus edulis]
MTSGHNGRYFEAGNRVHIVNIIVPKARGLNGVITISANDDATRAKVTIVDTGHTKTGASYSTTIQIKQKAYRTYMNAKKSTEVIHVTATDPDNGIGGVVTYSLVNKPPYFTGQPFNADIQEESPLGSTVDFKYPIRADDGDTGVPHQIEYNLTEGFQQSSSVKNSNLKMELEHRNLSSTGYDSRQWKYHALVASEVKSPNKTAQCTVHLEIIDRNDNLPQFKNSSFTVHISENETNVQQVLSEKVNEFILYEKYRLYNL